jgi:2-C-methyl-D-erythritol 2,4-cyclodiphosphate synthase
LEAREVRVGIGHDTHRLVEGRPLMLAGIRIPFDRGLAGHSDADVVLHAVADALLGAAGMGDIGEHFPDTDARWKDVESARLVAEVVALLAGEGWRPVNCDLTVHAQAPRLVAFKGEMRSSLARLLGLDVADVNVKAKTGEHVGPIGRGEAISCEAAVLIDRA